MWFLIAEVNFSTLDCRLQLTIVLSRSDANRFSALRIGRF